MTVLLSNLQARIVAGDIRIRRLKQQRTALAVALALSLATLAGGWATWMGCQ